MDTALEALFKTMMVNDWFIRTDGSVEAPTGFFGWTWYEQAEIPEILQAFEETIEAYGTPADEEIVGAFTAVVDGNGIIWITRHESKGAAQRAFNKLGRDYTKWVHSG